MHDVTDWTCRTRRGITFDLIIIITIIIIASTATCKPVRKLILDPPDGGAG